MYLVFVDLAVAITFFIISVLFYWCHLEEDTSIEKFDTFIPFRITVLWFILFVKFFFDVFYLSKRFGSDKLNRSEVTPYLFWFRIWYDVTLIGGILIIFTYYWKQKSLKLVVSNTFKLFVIIVPKAIIEFILYRWSLLPAYKRSIYQKFSKWKKGQINPRDKEKQQQEFFEKM